MSDNDKKTAYIRVIVTTSEPGSERIPKFIELFDRSLKAVRRQWYQSNRFSIDRLEAGTYTLRLSLSSGVQKDETFDLKEGEIKEINISIENNSPHESHEWAYFNKNFSIQSSRDTNLKSIQYYLQEGKLVSGRLWKYNQDNWNAEPLPQFMNQQIFNDGNVFEYNTDDHISLLEISGEDMPNLYVSLPPGNQLKCLVKLAEVTDENIHPIDVTVSTENFKAETLLTLLTNGAISEAKTLSNAKEAEDLLYQKMVNPVTAAIGGYFLLKIGELERLHNWANNLANWFSWLPDGAIIYATQLLNKKEKSPEDIIEIRNLLLHASKIGLPVYSEGLRLLEKGLTQLWYHSGQKDDEIKKAHDRIGNYLEVSDSTQETITFTGTSPAEPGRTKLPGKTIEDPFDIRKRKKDNRGKEREFFESVPA